ncbi:outer envelope pore protein 24, chloroplastic-like protein [Tanacetum coccineum]|uniref:Outer envelope pore protein 24, chloroplastic-like protein n=1 Tax=Tanacetum coccineum TaxID=301880 RepID=A0ABQ4YE03_9ASTR
MMKATFKGSYDPDNSDATGSVVLNAGNINLRASVTNDTFVNGPSINGLTLSLESPGSFTVDYNLPKKDVRFQFMNTVRVSGRPLNLSYSHSVFGKQTKLDSVLMLDENNKVSANYGFESGNCEVKYSYVHGGVMTFEPRYDFGDKSWDLALSRRISDDSVVRGSYRSSTKVLGLDLTKSSFANGSFKVSASVNLAEEKKTPKITAESIWDFEM